MWITGESSGDELSRGQWRFDAGTIITHINGKAAKDYAHHVAYLMALAQDRTLVHYDYTSDPERFEEGEGGYAWGCHWCIEYRKCRPVRRGETLSLAREMVVSTSRRWARIYDRPITIADLMDLTGLGYTWLALELPRLEQLELVAGGFRPVKGQDDE